MTRSQRVECSHSGADEDLIRLVYDIVYVGAYLRGNVSEERSACILNVLVLL